MSPEAVMYRAYIKPPAKESNAEGDLVRRLQAGNHAGFSDFVERYQSKVCRVAYGILGNRDDADDIVQQVFMQVYFSIKGSEGRSSLYSWLHRLVVSKCYEFLRKKRLTVSYETSWERSYGTARMRIRWTRTRQLALGGYAAAPVRESGLYPLLRAPRGAGPPPSQWPIFRGRVFG